MSIVTKSALAAAFVAATLTSAIAQTATRQIVVEEAQPKAASTIVAQAATPAVSEAKAEAKDVVAETPATEAAPAKVEPPVAPAVTKPVVVPAKPVKKFAHDYGYAHYGYAPSHRPHYGDNCQSGARYSHRGSYRSY